MSPLLDVENLYLYYRTRKGPVKAVDGVSFSVNAKETLALVGESGCGKSSLVKALLRLLPRNVYLYKGRVIFQGKDLMSLDEEEIRKIRWAKISLVTQGALDALNPVIKVVDQVAEPLIIHKGVDKETAIKEAKNVLCSVGIPESLVERYPFELSGGMRQRAIIAMALVMNADLIILDEPTSALDILTQTNIMNMLKKFKNERHFTYILITHDIAVSSELADKVAVMYAGQIVEFSPAEVFYKSPYHPYSNKLMASVPTLRTEKKIEFIPGTPPSLIDPPRGCRFAERCPYRTAKCSEDPPLVDLGGDSYVRCWLYA